MSHAYSRVWRGVFALALLLLTAASTGLAQWVEAPSVPSARTMAMIAASTDKVYVFGGATDGIVPNGYLPSTATSTAWVWNVAGSSWTQLTGMPQTRAAGYVAYSNLNGKFYIVGGVSYSGTTRTFPASVLEFDPATNAYTPKANMPIPVCGFTGATVGGKIYVMGGIAPSGTSFTFPTTIQVYDIATNTWSQSPNDAPYSVIYGSATSVGSDIILVGGADAGQNFTVTQNAYKGTVSPNGIVWSQLPDYPLPALSVAGGSLANKPYFAGGLDQNDQPIRNSYVWDNASSSWKGGYGLPIALGNVSELPTDGTSLFYVSGTGGNKKTFKLSPGADQSVAEVGPTHFVLTTKTGTSAAAVIKVTNWGTAPLSGSVEIGAADQAWLSTSNLNFSDIAPGTSQNLTINAGSSGTAQGNYTGTVTVHTNDPTHATNAVTISLYVRDQLAQQKTKVVVEEGTGTWCGWCPYSHRILDDIQSQHGQDMILIAYHGYVGTNDPWVSSTIDNLTTRLGLTGYPNASFLRWYFPGEPAQMVNRDKFAAYFDAVLATQPNAPIKLDVTKYKYDDATKTVTATLHVTTAQAMEVTSSVKFNVNAVVKEDGIVHQQTEYGTPQGTVEHDDYVHNNIVRTLWPDEKGRQITLPTDAIQDNVLLPGSEFDVNVTFPVTCDNPDNCKTVFLIQTSIGTSSLGPILQGTELALKSSIGQGGTQGVNNAATAGLAMSLSAGVPNPASTSATFEYSVPTPGNVNVEVYDMVGKKVLSNNVDHVEAGTHSFNLDVNNLVSGVYTVRLTSNGASTSRMMTIAR
ncbi:MAG TPA: kelch repeat-containing protein [Candidatus Kapabacteria bacterium]|nr:kelch repeat-containing protein [Candidatus Kapabacteria bacterium]